MKDVGISNPEKAQEQHLDGTLAQKLNTTST